MDGHVRHTIRKDDLIVLHRSGDAGEFIPVSVFRKNGIAGGMIDRHKVAVLRGGGELAENDLRRGLFGRGRRGDRFVDGQLALVVQNPKLCGTSDVIVHAGIAAPVWAIRTDRRGSEEALCALGIHGSQMLLLKTPGGGIRADLHAVVGRRDGQATVFAGDGVGSLFSLIREDGPGVSNRSFGIERAVVDRNRDRSRALGYGCIREDIGCAGFAGHGDRSDIAFGKIFQRNARPGGNRLLCARSCGRHEGKQHCGKQQDREKSAHPVFFH